MSRAIALNEAAVVRWLLDHAGAANAATYQVLSVGELMILEGCPCGCASLDFQPDAWRGSEIVADALAVYPDGQQAGLILWGREGEIVLLEIYDCHPEASHRFPDIPSLRTYDAPPRDLP